MAIPTPYYVYGTIIDKDTNAVTSETVTIINRTQSNVEVTGTTGDNGEYVIDISQLSSISDGDTLEVRCVYDTQSSSESFTLDIEQPSKEIYLILFTTIPSPYYLYGQITDSDDSGIDGAIVVITNNTQSCSTSIETESDGSYLSDISIIASDDDSITVSCTYNSLSNSSTFTIDITEPSVEVNLKLSGESVPTPYYVYGLVTDSDSNVLDSATVRITDNSNSNYVETTTNADGSYSKDISEITGIKDGHSLTVLATYSGDSNDSTFTLDIDEPSKEINIIITLTGVEEELPSPYYLYGYITDKNGSGANSAVITITDTNTSETLITTSNVDGSYLEDISTIDNIKNTHNITIEVTYGTQTGSASFTIDILKPSEEQNITLSETAGTYTYDYDLAIYYNDTNYVEGRCSRWDVSNYSVVVETWLSKTDMDNLINNIVPGAVGELYKILGRPTYYDQTWQSNNTIRLYPTPSSNLMNNSTLHIMRDEQVIFPKNITTHPINDTPWIHIKIEGLISGNQDL